MRKFKLTAMLAMASFAAMAQNEIVETAVTLVNDAEVAAAADTAKWTFPGSMGLNANQAYFSDYSIDDAGLSVSLDAFLNLNANYKKGKNTWENSLSAKYGFIFSNQFLYDDNGGKIRKNVDELILNTKYGYKVSKVWYLSAFANLETQLSSSYTYGDQLLTDMNGKDSLPKERISHFFAPGYIKASIGMEAIPNQYFSAFISPVTGRFTVCRLDELGENYAMELLEDGTYKHVRSELGAYFKLKSDFDITKNLHFFSTLEGFYAYNKAVQDYTAGYLGWYSDQIGENDLNDMIAEGTEFDFSTDAYESEVGGDAYKATHGWYLKWKVELLLHATKYLDISLKTQLKYDNGERKTVMDKEDKIRGKYDNVQGLQKAGFQFWETVSLGVTYSF